jgi:hypothetical protein
MFGGVLGHRDRPHLKRPSDGAKPAGDLLG